ncbi:adenyl-nucleotide exchange factor sse1, partial [Entophlyctis luteolus]
AEDRPRAERLFREAANSFLLNLAADDDRYSHIAAPELDKARKEVEGKLSWLNTQIAKVNQQNKHEDPSVTVKQINTEKDSMVQFVSSILNKPKPAPVVTPKADETDNLGNTKEGEGDKKEESDEAAKEDANMDVD